MDETKRVDPIAGEIVHVYDGIEEADNALPTWWVAVFIGSIVFGALYWLAVERLHVVKSPSEEHALAVAERAKRSGQVSADELLAASHSPERVEKGRLAFTTNCAACHGARAEGGIGPNLTDENWLHGGSPLQIFTTIRDGVPAKGMPTWDAVLGAENVKSVAAYVLTLRNTRVPGKAPEGDVYADK